MNRETGRNLGGYRYWRVGVQRSGESEEKSRGRITMKKEMSASLLLGGILIAKAIEGETHTAVVQLRLHSSPVRKL